MIEDSLKTIPQISDPLGKHWEQPKREDLTIAGGNVFMSISDFGKLRNYSSSVPSGVYVGKMWKAQRRGIWFLCWFDVHPDPGYCSIKHLKIRLRETFVYKPTIHSINYK